METNKQLIQALASAVRDYEQALEHTLITGGDYNDLNGYFISNNMHAGLCYYFSQTYNSIVITYLIESLVEKSLKDDRSYICCPPYLSKNNKELFHSLQFRIEWMKTQIDWLTQMEEPDEPDARDFMEVRDDEEYINKINNSLKNNI